MRPQKLGRFGEDLVTRLLGFRRQPFSGGKWPFKEDLVREVGIPDFSGDLFPTTIHGEMAQVKTTKSVKFLKEFFTLEKHALAEQREPKWFEVVVTPNAAYVFEKSLVEVEPLGIDAVGGGRGGRRTKASCRVRRRVQDDRHQERRRDVVT